VEFSIGHRKLGPEHPPLVIVEVGINHEGSVEKALEMTDAAAAAGAEVVKFQCHITEHEMVPTDMTPGRISTERLWDIIKRCELTADEELRVQEYCAKKGVIYLSTPFSREAADRLDAMGVPAFKIGSGECNNIPVSR
jgi:sialic acid synthase SpsE